MPTVAEDVAFGPRNMALPEEEIERRVSQALDSVGCGALRDKSPAHLSGGQKRSVSIATVLAMEPDILVMDEPTVGLDYVARRQVMDIVATFDHTCLIATHDIDLARELCPRSLLLDNGEITVDGDTEYVVKHFLH